MCQIYLDQNNTCHKARKLRNIPLKWGYKWIFVGNFRWMKMI
jgi:hypothetical protein